MILWHKLALEGKEHCRIHHSMCKALGLTLPSPAGSLQVYFKGEGQTMALHHACLKPRGEPSRQHSTAQQPVSHRELGRTAAGHCETGLEQPVGIAGGSGGARLHLPISPQISLISSEFPYLLRIKASWEQGCCSSCPTRRSVTLCMYSGTKCFSVLPFYDWP